MTKGLLLDYNQQLQHLQSHNAVVLFLLKSRVKEFYKENGQRILTLLEEQRTINKAFYEQDENGAKLVDNKMILLEGRTEEEFHETTSKLLAQKVGEKINFIF